MIYLNFFMEKIKLISSKIKLISKFIYYLYKYKKVFEFFKIKKIKKYIIFSLNKVI